MPARDRVAMQVLPGLLRRDRTHLTWITLHSPDKSEHVLWNTVQPHEADPVMPERVLALAAQYNGPAAGLAPAGWGSVASQYLEIDAWLGGLLAEFHFDYVVLVSDHGMARNEEGGLPGQHGLGFTNAHRGILAIRGPGVRRGADIGRVDVRDFAPTLAYLLDLPVGEDLPGRVLEEAFTRGRVRARPVHRVPTWEADLSGWQPPPPAPSAEPPRIKARARERRTGPAWWR
jgi:hypothetical protein